jgi:hypothetical protein
MVESSPPKSDKTNAKNETAATAIIPTNEALPTTDQGRDCRYNKTRDCYDCVTLLIALFGLGGLWYYAYWSRVQATETIVATEAASSSAQTAKLQLELSQRPWVLASYEIDKEHPLTVLDNGSVTIEFKESLENSGGSAAIDVGSWVDIVPIGPNSSRDAATKRQAQYCDGRRTWNSNKGNVTGFVLFPKHERTITQGTGLVATDLTKAVDTLGDPYKRIGFYIVGCVWYRTLFEPSEAPFHQTRFAYLLAKPVGAQEVTSAILQSGIPIGAQPMVEPKGTPEGLDLNNEEWGNSAD